MRRLKRTCRYCGKSGRVVNGAHAECLRRYVRDYCRVRRRAHLGAKRAGVRIPKVGDVFVPSRDGAPHRCAPFKCVSTNTHNVLASDEEGERWKFQRSAWDFSIVNQ